jgi:hypothetical protein
VTSKLFTQDYTLKGDNDNYNIYIIYIYIYNSDNYKSAYVRNSEHSPSQKKNSVT